MTQEKDHLLTYSHHLLRYQARRLLRLRSRSAVDAPDLARPEVSLHQRLLSRLAVICPLSIPDGLQSRAAHSVHIGLADDDPCGAAARRKERLHERDMLANDVVGFLLGLARQ